MDRISILGLRCVGVGLIGSPARAENPLIRNVFSADPVG